MTKAIWRKFEKANFGATMKEANRNLNGFDAALITIYASDGIEGHSLLIQTIGKVLIDRYNIQTI